MTQTFTAGREEDVDGNDKAYVSAESHGNCSLMHTCKGLIKRTQSPQCISTSLSAPSSCGGVAIQFVYWLLGFLLVCFYLCLLCVSSFSANPTLFIFYKQMIRMHIFQAGVAVLLNTVAFVISCYFSFRFCHVGFFFFPTQPLLRLFNNSPESSVTH